MVEAILKLLRGSVRPAVMLGGSAAVIGLFVYHGVTVNALEGAAGLATFTGPAMGWWFKERSDRHRDGTV